MKQKLTEQFIRMQKLAGIITENLTPSKKINLTPIQKKEFFDAIKDLSAQEDFEYALGEAGNVLANILTNGEAEYIEDVEDFGYDAEEVEQYAMDLAGESELDENQGSNNNMLDFSSWRRIMGDDNVYQMIPPSENAEETLDIMVYPTKNKVMIASSDDNMIQTIADKYNKEVYQEMAPSVYQVNLELKDLTNLFPGQDWFL